jgi:hypothetical protein
MAAEFIIVPYVPLQMNNEANGWIADQGARYVADANESATVETCAR